MDASTINKYKKLVECFPEIVKMLDRNDRRDSLKKLNNDSVNPYFIAAYILAEEKG